MFLFFILIPILEIFLVYKMIVQFGFLNSFLYFVVSLLLGSSLIKNAGSNVFHFLAGILFLVPGLLSDIVAILLLIPGLNFLFKKVVAKFFANSINTQGGRIFFKFSNIKRPQGEQGDIIEADFVDLSKDSNYTSAQVQDYAITEKVVRRDNEQGL